MTFLRTTAFVVLAFAMSGGAGATFAASDDSVAATVDGHKILLSDVRNARGLLPPQLQAQPLEVVYPLLLDSLVNTHIAAQKAKKLGLHEDPDYQQRMARIGEQILERILLTRHIETLVNEDTLTQRYDELVVQSKDQHEVHARHILVKAEDVANAVIEKLDDGDDFADLAKEFSIGPSADSGGDLGWFGPGRMVPEFDAAAMALEKGAYTKKPVRTQFGWHIITVEDTRPVEVPPFEQVRPTLVNELSAELGQKLMEQLRQDTKVDKVEFKDLK